MPRTARLDTPGTLHHIIVRGFEQRKLVDDNRDQDNFVFRMGTFAIETAIGSDKDRSVPYSRTIASCDFTYERTLQKAKYQY